MKKRLLDGKGAVIAHDASVEVAQPGDAALDHPAPLVVPAHTPVQSPRGSARNAVRCPKNSVNRFCRDSRGRHSEYQEHREATTRICSFCLKMSQYNRRARFRSQGDGARMRRSSKALFFNAEPDPPVSPD